MKINRILTAALVVFAGNLYAADFSDLAVKATDLKALAAADGITVPAISRDYMEHVEPATPIEWVFISGGKFAMGTDTGGKHYKDAMPIHEVSIKTFDISKTVVTVEQYNECVVKGGCTVPYTGRSCNWGKAGRELHPVNCVNWDQANQYARFKGGRLPSESEWEYAANGGGKSQKYPWGNDEPTCDKAVMPDVSGYGCGTNDTMPVCSKPAGNTVQGLCDMVGNVRQWVQDEYQDGYYTDSHTGAPVDGSAFAGWGAFERVIRGSSFDIAAKYMRVVYRSHLDPGISVYFGIGFRIAKSR